MYEGDTKLANQLFAEIEQAEAEAIQRAAEAAYQRGRIAEDEIRWADAARHYKRSAQLSPDLHRLNMMLEFLWRSGDYASAVVVGKELIETARLENDETSAAFATALNNHVLMLETMGRYEEAEPLYRQAIEIDKATIGEAHPNYATRLFNLAVFLEGRGRLDEVLDLYRDAIRISRASLGDDHPNTKNRAWNFASYLRKHDATSPDLTDLIAVFGDDIGR